jgi:outer membrane protein OmpA-like peptidoglycan-associated protein
MRHRRVSRRGVNSALLAAIATGWVPLMPRSGAASSLSAATAQTTTTPSPTPPILPFEEAVTDAAQSVLASAPIPQQGSSLLVIDPLVDEVTGYQSNATRSIQDQIVEIVHRRFPKYAVQSITARSLEKQPRFLIGTFTPINAALKPSGTRESYWFCLVMGDLKTGKIVAKAVSRARMNGVDAAPTTFFDDSPVWTDDPSIKAYVATCKASKVGDPIRPEYLDGLLAASLVNEAGNAYAEGHYREAFNLYNTALQSKAGEQLRVYSGIYLALVKLGRSSDATSAFGNLVEYAIRKKRLAIKFLFRPGSVRFAADDRFSASYEMWLQQIADHAASSHACLQISGHTRPTGSALLNDRLSLLRAEYIRSSLIGYQASLNQHTSAAGVGSRENLIGTGKDDASDALDRRVEMKPVEPCREGNST